MRGQGPKGLALVSVMAALALLAAAPGAHAQSLKERLDGLKLPPKFGLNLAVYNQTQDYDFVSLEIGLPGVDLSQVENLPVKNETDTSYLMADYWVLPFLNVFGLVGSVSGTTTVRLGDIDVGLPIRLGDLRIHYSGTVYGGGATLAVGNDTVFSSLTYEYTSTDLDVTDSSVEAWVVTAKLGRRITDAGAAWMGVMYQSVDEHHTGTYELPYVGSFPFDVKFDARQPYNFLLGAIVGVGEHWTFTMEGGIGGRNTALLQLGYRF